MNKFIMIFSFFILALGGCSKSDEDKCKEKGWFWNESTKACTETSPDGTPVAAAETEESCKAKAGHMWNKNNSQCKKVGYFMLIRPEDSDLRHVYVALRRGSEASRMDELMYLQEEECVKIPEAYLSHLFIRVQISYWSSKWNDVCSNLVGSEKKCELGVYEVKYVDDSVLFQAITLDTERTDCKVLKLIN